MSISQVTVWKCSDGTLYEQEDKALLYEEKLQRGLVDLSFDHGYAENTLCYYAHFGVIKQGLITAVTKAKTYVQRKAGLILEDYIVIEDLKTKEMVCISGEKQIKNRMSYNLEDFLYRETL